jgi:hypothetical protein
MMKKKNKISTRQSVLQSNAAARRTANSDLHVLHTTCDDVLRTVTLLSTTTPRFNSVSEFGSQLHELGITLGSLDRILRHFICDVLLAGTDLDPHLALDSSLSNALKLSQKTPAVKRTSLLRGGVASHLFLFSLVLRKARVAIRGADALESNNYTSTRFAYGTVSGAAALQLGRILLRTRPQSRSAWYAAVVAGTFTWWWMTWYQAQRHVVELRRSNARLIYLLRMWTIVVNVVHQAQLRRATSYVQLTTPSNSINYSLRNTPKVKRVAELGEIEVEERSNDPTGNSDDSKSSRRPSKGHAAKSFLSLVSMPHDEDVAHVVSSSKFTSSSSSFRGLVHVAPPPTTFAFWYDDLLVDGNIVSRWGIKHGLNVLYASCSIALACVGRRWYATLGRVVQSCVIPWYAMQPTAAASRAHYFLCNADAQDIQIAWSPMMHDMAIPIALSLHSRGSLAVAELMSMEYQGAKTESYVFSVSY